MARLGPLTKRYARAVLRFSATMRLGLLTLERQQRLSARLAAIRGSEEEMETLTELHQHLEVVEGMGRESAGLRVAGMDQLDAAAEECQAAQAPAFAAWERGEERMPKRWLLRKVAEMQALLEEMRGGG